MILSQEEDGSLRELEAEDCHVRIKRISRNAWKISLDTRTGPIHHLLFTGHGKNPGRGDITVEVVKNVSNGSEAARARRS